MVDMATYGLMVPVLPFRLASIGYHNIPARSSYLIAAFALGLIISSIPIGILGEIVKARKLPLLICLAFLAGSLIMFWLSTSFPLLVISRIFQGISGTGIWTLGLALICDVVPEALIGSIMGYVMIGWSIGTVAGPLAGGLLYDSLGYHSIFVFALVLTAMDFIFRVLVQDKQPDTPSQVIFSPRQQPRSLSVETVPVIEPSNQVPTTLMSDQKSEATADGKKSKSAGDSTNSILSPSLKTPTTYRALLSLLRSPRCWTLFTIILVLGFSFGGLLDAGMTLIVHKRYGLSSRGAALIFIGAVVPSFVSSPLAGHFADKYGARLPVATCLILGTPFFGLLSMEGSLSTFIVWIALTGLFVMAVAAPIMQDLAEVVKVTPGLGYAHVYGIFNMVYSTGALIGPLVVGGVFEHVGVERGWKLVSLISTVLCAACVLPAWLFIGDKSLAIGDESLTKDPKLSHKADLQPVSNITTTHPNTMI